MKFSDTNLANLNVFHISRITVCDERDEEFLTFEKRYIIDRFKITYQKRSKPISFIVHTHKMLFIFAFILQ